MTHIHAIHARIPKFNGKIRPDFTIIARITLFFLLLKCFRCSFNRLAFGIARIHQTAGREI